MAASSSSAAGTAPSGSTSKVGYFTGDDGQNYTVTFFLVASLFLLWGFCNGMIDTMDKHFQDHLGLTKAQSAWVQFAHYMGYSLMALPAGLLTRRMGYKWGIIIGLILVALGGFWFMPATWLAQFWAFLLGVCLIAMGLTVLETVANPYTTVLGPKQYGASRINLAQSFNGVGWIFGPIVGAAYFYSEGGVQQAHGQLYIPYVAVGVVVLVIAVAVYFARVPDVKVQDEFHTDESGSPKETAPKEKSVGAVFGMMFLNALVAGLSVYLVLHTILPSIGVGDTTINNLSWIVGLLVLATVPKLWSVSKSITTHSIWAHPHFSGATLAQFVYVAAQAGIFSFFINTMTVDRKTGFTIVPPISPEWAESFKSWVVAGGDGVFHISDAGAAKLSSIAFGCFLLGRVIGAALLRKAPAHKVLGTFAALNIGVCLLIIGNLGWISVLSVFLSYFLMSIMFPTIFALGIFGLGGQAKKKASAFIVMSITGGALMPKLMGYLGDEYNMAAGFWMPLVCFVLIALYGFSWSKLSQAESLTGLSPAKGH
jgi:FHS family L-fucose permease-like MFS transporter